MTERDDLFEEMRRQFLGATFLFAEGRTAEAERHLRRAHTICRVLDALDARRVLH